MPPFQLGASTTQLVDQAGGGFLQGLANALGPFNFDVNLDMRNAPVSTPQQYWAPMVPQSPLPNIHVPSPPGIPLNPNPGPMQASNPFSLIAQNTAPVSQNYATDATPGGFSQHYRHPAPPDLVAAAPTSAPNQGYMQFEDGSRKVLTNDNKWETIPAMQGEPPWSADSSLFDAHRKSDPLDEAYAYDQQHGAGAYERSRGLPPPGAAAPQAIPSQPQMNRVGRAFTAVGDAFNPYGKYQRNYGQYLQAATADRAAARQQEFDMKRYEKEQDYSKQELVNKGSLAVEELKQAHEDSRKMWELATQGQKLSMAEGQKTVADALSAPPMSPQRFAAAAMLKTSGYLDRIGRDETWLLGMPMDPKAASELREQASKEISAAEKAALEVATSMYKKQQERYAAIMQGADAGYADQNAASNANAKQFGALKSGLDLAVGMQTAPADMQRPFLQNDQTQLGMANTLQGMDVRQLTALSNQLLYSGQVNSPQGKALMTQISERLGGLQAGAMQPPNESREAYQGRISNQPMPQIQQMVPPPPPVVPGGGLPPQYMPAGYQQQPMGAPPMGQPMPQQPPAMPMPAAAAPPPVQQMPTSLGSPVPKDGFGPVAQFGRALNMAGKEWERSNAQIANSKLASRNITEVEISEQLNKEIKAGLGAEAAGQQRGATLTDPQIKQRFYKESDGDARKLMGLVKYAGWGDIDWQDNARQIRQIANRRK